MGSTLALPRMNSGISLSMPGYLFTVSEDSVARRRSTIHKTRLD